MSSEASTPPHHPTYNVYLSPGRINHIVSALYPDHTANVTEAPRGTSYNNRIYFLEIAPTLKIPASDPVKPLNAVLKLSGHFFSHTKIQNEIGSLLLLARHCPSVQAPLVIAWSEDGRTISTHERTISDASDVESEGHHGWILMTRLPGRTLTNADLDGPSGPTIIRQIAQANVLWRTAIPSVPMFGNIRHRPTELAHDSGATTKESAPLDQAYTIGGFLLCHRYDPAPITRVFQYYTYMLKDQIHRVMTSPSYDQVRCDMVPLIADFVQQDLPKLSFVQYQNEEIPHGVFTHMDLAPRNILVQEDDTGGGTLQVSGMVDFEFAAFLPELDEFVNAHVRQEGDWTEKHYRTLLNEMSLLGCKVPPVGHEVATVIDGIARAPAPAANTFPRQEWNEACLLWKLIDNIAPWYIMDGKMSDEELETELDKAGKIVRECIRDLQKLRPGEQRLGTGQGGGTEG